MQTAFNSWRWLQAYVRCFPLLAMAVSLMVAWDPQSPMPDCSVSSNHATFQGLEWC